MDGRNKPDIWLIGRIDQIALVAEHLVSQNRLARWDSFIRFRTPIERRLLGRLYPKRMLPSSLENTPGSHYWPELISEILRAAGAPISWRHWAGLFTLDLLASVHVPKHARLLHGQHSYCLWTARRARRAGKIFLLEIISQTSKQRRDQLAGEYEVHGLPYEDRNTTLGRTEATLQIADGVLVPNPDLVEPVARSVCRNLVYSRSLSRLLLKDSSPSCHEPHGSLASRFVFCS
jgi:hypothetical protein